MNLEDRVGRLEHLIALIKQMLAAEEQTGLFTGLLECVTAFADAERAFVLFSEAGRPQVRAAHALDRKTVRSEAFRRIRRIADHVLEHGEAFLTASLARDDRFREEEYDDEGEDRAVTVVPLRNGERTVGVIYVDRPAAGGEGFDPRDLGMLQDIADIAALGIEARNRVRQLRASRDELRLVNMTLERMATSLQEDVAAKSVELSRFERDLDVKNRALRSTYTFKNIVGRSPQMHRVFDVLNQVMDYPSRC
ncbi:MAG: GAF domain-containing protein [Myxococcales bacterium]|nr:GAF domain-containing protein [Myxococcales bacterium]